MIFISYDSKIKRINIWKLVILILIMGTGIYLINAKFSSLTIVANTSLSFFLGLISSIIVEFTIDKGNTVFDSSTIGTLLGKIRDGDDEYVDNFNNKFLKWYTGRHRFLHLDETNLSDEMRFLLLVYNSCWRNRRLPNTLDVSKLINNITKRKSCELSKYGIDISILEVIFFINATYLKSYFGLKYKYDYKIKKIPNDLNLLYEFTTKSLEEIKEPYVHRFCKITMELKELISYNSEGDKKYSILLVFEKYLELQNEIFPNENYRILTNHILLQISNCLIFSNQWVEVNVRTQRRLNEILSRFQFESIHNVWEFIKQYYIRDDLFGILFSSMNQDSPLVLSQFENRIELLEKQYSDIINISIVNSMSTILESRNPEAFIETYYNTKQYYEKDSPSNIIYHNSFIMGELIAYYLEGNYNKKELMDRINSIVQDENDNVTRRSAIINAFIFSCLLHDTEAFMHIVRKHINTEEIMSNEYAKDLLAIIKEKKFEVDLFSLPLWYPVSIMLKHKFIPFVDSAKFREYFTL